MIAIKPATTNMEIIIKLVIFLSMVKLYNKAMFGRNPPSPKAAARQGENTEEQQKEKVKERKRKEKKTEKEAKPWGKSERYLLLSVLVFTVLTSAVLAMMARSWKLPGLPRVGIPDDPFEEKFILENETKPANDDASQRQERITKNFEEVTKNLSGVYGFEVVDLATGSKFGLHQTEEFQAASLIKLPVMAMMFEQAEEKRISLSTKHSLTEEEKVAGSGSLYYEPAGTVITNRELIEYMGKQSDNTAFNIAVNTFGESKVEEYIYDLGMRDTSIETNMTTIRDISSFFRKLWELRIVEENYRDEFLDYLTDTTYENHLAKGIPEDIRVAHKYGAELHVINDAGIVFTENPFIVVIMSKGIVESEANAIFPELSRLIYEGMIE